jgi:DNA replication protein DnaC
MWDESELQQHAAENYLERLRERQERNILDEMLYSQTFHRLSTQSRMSVDRMVAHDASQMEALESIFSGVQRDESQQQRHRHWGGNDFISCLYDGTGSHELKSCDEVVELARNLRHCKLKKEKAKSSKIIEPEVQQHNLRNVEESMGSDEQKEIFNLYSNYLYNPENPNLRPPDVVLLHGAAGTGKSTVLRGISKAASICLRKTLNTAFNNINALDLAGVTTAKVISLNMKTDMYYWRHMTFEKRRDLQRMMRNVFLVIVDEISTQAPFHLAQLSWAIQQTQEETATSVNMNEFFGGIPAILSGDLNQLGPVKAGDCLTGAVMKVLQHKYGAISKSKRRRR